MVFQGDSYLNYLSNRNSVFADAGNITAENMHKLSQYCYIYLKSCYVTREAALASLESKSSSTKAKIQPLIDYQNSINTEIAKIMVNLKGSNKSNEGCMFGFLPSDNKNYIRSCTNSRRTHLDGKFSACLCQKILKYTQYSCAFLASAVKKFARQSAHFSYWYSF